MLNAEGVADIIDFNYSPFGNNYFATSECGGAGSYSVTARQCYNDKCGRDASSRPADCFTGAVVTQHGDAEGNSNRYIACAKGLESDTLKYMAFVECVEAGYGKDVDTLAQSCSKTFDFSGLKSCYDGDAGDAAIIAEAKNTPAHQGVPYMEIDGKEAQTTGILAQVCAAYTGSKPAGCTGTVSV